MLRRLRRRAREPRIHTGDPRFGLHPALLEDPLLKKVYLMDLALFISAEHVSYLAVSGMMGCAPDELAVGIYGTTSNVAARSAGGA